MNFFCSNFLQFLLCINIQMYVCMYYECQAKIKVSGIYLLNKQNIIDPNMSPLGYTASETPTHFVLQCNRTRDIWNSLGVQLSSDGELLGAFSLCSVQIAHMKQRSSTLVATTISWTLYMASKSFIPPIMAAKTIADNVQVQTHRTRGAVSFVVSFLFLLLVSYPASVFVILYYSHCACKNCVGQGSPCMPSVSN